MPHGINTVVKTMKPPSGNRTADGLLGVTQPPKLSNRNHAVLASGQSRQLLSRGRG